jgi:hypothetical protein
VAGDWKRLHNVELHNLYSSTNKISIIMRWAGHVPRMGEMKNAYKILVGKAEANRPLGRPKRRREDNIRMKIGW